MEERKSPGPKRKFGPRVEIHLKFSSEVMEYIKQHSPQGYQAYFDKLVQQEMSKEHKGE